MYSYRQGCLAMRGNMVRILVIGSYVYHSDVIATTTQINANIITCHLLFTNLLHMQTCTDVTVFLRYLIVCCVDSKEFRTRTLIQ